MTEQEKYYRRLNREAAEDTFAKWILVILLCLPMIACLG